MRLFVPALLVMMVTSGCIVHGRVGASATVRPNMVLVSDGVYVIEDYDEPVFYSDGSYWLYSGGVWYSSYTYTGGWVRVARPHYRVARIQRPHTYVHWRVGGGGGGRGRTTVVTPANRDHRTVRVRPGHTKTVRPGNRDHRDGRPKNVRTKPKKGGGRDHR